VTVFALADVPAPEIVLDPGHSIATCAGTPGRQVLSARVEMPDLTCRLAGHVRRVDHTGVNVPASAISPEQWRNLVYAIASVSTMYRYPTGEEWPFVLPSTSAELHGDIRDFLVGRASV
jgi:hypothetical protein